MNEVADQMGLCNFSGMEFIALVMHIAEREMYIMYYEQIITKIKLNSYEKLFNQRI